MKITRENARRILGISPNKGDIIKVSARSNRYGYPTEASVGIQCGTYKGDYLFPKEKRAYYNEYHFGEDSDVKHIKLPNGDVKVTETISGNYSMYYTGKNKNGEITESTIPVDLFIACQKVKSGNPDQFLEVI